MVKESYSFIDGKKYTASHPNVCGPEVQLPDRIPFVKAEVVIPSRIKRMVDRVRVEGKSYGPVFIAPSPKDTYRKLTTLVKTEDSWMFIWFWNQKFLMPFKPRTR